MRKVWAAIAGVILLWTSSVLAPSAAGHDGHADWFKWREPEDNTDVSGKKVTLRAKVHFEEGIRRWTLNVLPPDGYATVHTWGIVCESAETEETEKKPKTVEIVCEWDTTTYPDGTPSQNHAYRARVSAWNDKPSSGPEEGEAPEGGGEEGGGEEGGGSEDAAETTTSTTTGSTDADSSSSTSSSSPTTTTTEAPAPAGQVHHSPVRTLVVANPPSAPNGVRLAFQKKASQATVSWDPNPEPDIAHYLVEERFDGGDWSLVAKTTDTSWKGRLEEKGSYRFRVAAVRYVGSKERVKEGPRREPQSGMRKVEHDPDENTTESTEPEPASSGGKRKDREEEERKKAEERRRREQEPESDSTTTTAPPGSVIVNYDGAGDAPTSTAGDTGNGPAASGLAPIEAGSPGSVQTRYADPPRLPAPVSPEQAYDPGFSLALPYPKEVRLDIGPPPEPPPRLLGTVALFDSNEEQRRALVGVLAGGLVVFMVSMQAAYLTRRPRPIDLAASTDWD